MYFQNNTSQLVSGLLRSSFVSALTLCLLATATSAQEKPEDKTTYDDHVKAIFVRRCSTCHNGQKREGDLDVTNYTNLMQGGGSGTVIESQDSPGSYLFQLITHQESPEMPPGGTKIPDPEIQLIAKWIDMGALENKGSKAAKAKPKLDMAVGESATARPEVAPVPLRMPLEPAVTSERPSVIAIATSPWAPVAAVAAPKQILLYNTQTLELTGVLPMEEGLAHSLRFSRNGSLLLAGGGQDGASGKTILWNVITGERIATVGDELETVLAADITASQDRIALGGPNKLVKVYSTADGSLAYELNKHTEWVTAIEFSPDGKFLASGDRNGGLHVWESDTGNEVFTLKGHTGSISAISWRIDSQIVATASEDASIKLWELTNGTQVKTWAAHGGGATAMEFARDGQIVSCGRDKVAKLWDQNGKMIHQFAGLTDVGVSVSFDDETNRVLAGDWAGQLKVWNAADAVLVGDLVSNPPKLADRLAAAQQQLAAANQKLVPLAEQVAQTQVALDGLGTSLAAAQQTQSETQAKLTESEAQLAAAKLQLESTVAQQAQWRTERDLKATAQPLIKETIDKAVATSQALPEDPELKTALATLQAKQTQVQTRVTELEGLVAKSDQEKATTQAQMDELAKITEATKAQVATAIAEVAKLQGEMAAKTEQLKTETASATAAQAEVAGATQTVQRWTSDIAFISQLSELKTKLDTTEEVIDEKQTVVETANQQLLAAQQQFDAAAQQKAEVEKQAAELKQQIHQLRGGK